MFVPGRAKVAHFVLFSVFVAGCSGANFQPLEEQPDAAGASGSAGASTKPDAGATNGEPNGAPCETAGDCASGSCTDGVCCDRACDGECEACDASGSLGTCKPYAAGTDPEAECAGAGSFGDTCAGSCNGSSACEFPGAETSCGATTCTAGEVSGEVCSGGGACVVSTGSCGLYACGASECKSSCTSDADCAAEAFCKAGSCEPKQPNGASCGGKNECDSDLCEGGFCCGSACGAPSTCETGECLCAGEQCNPGVACITWYLDLDVDGFGASGVHDKVGCADKPPMAVGLGEYYATSSDCDDGNKNVFPGQTKFFTTPRSDGSFDYDCSGGITKEHAVKNTSTCKECGQWSPWGCFQCDALGALNESYGLECNPGTCGGVKIKRALTKDVACGAYSQGVWCSNPCNPIAESWGATQGCR